MKAVIVFNQLNDIVFVHYDKGFSNHVSAKWTDGQTNACSSNTLDPNILMQMFSPLISSQRVMTEQCRNPYQTIQCANGFLFVIEQYHDHMLLAINGDGLEREEFMRRKLLVLQRLLRFLYGPCDEEVKPGSRRDRDLRWTFISRLLDTWIELYGTEQCFLVEAIERLNVNQLLNVKCIELMEMTLSAIKSNASESGVLHAFTLVNCKLLSLFSVRSAFELLPSDLLLIILLVRCQFKQREPLEEFFSQSLKNPSNSSTSLGRENAHLSGSLSADHTPLTTQPENEVYQSAPEEQIESEELDEMFSSVPSSPRNGSDNDARYSNDTGNKTEEEKEKAGFSEALPFANDPHVGRDISEEELLETILPCPNEHNPTVDYRSLTVMLGTPNCKYTPHTLHCMQIMPGIVVVVICEGKHAKQSGPICQTISILRALLHQVGTSTLQGKQTIEYIDHSIRKILEITKKVKNNRLLNKILGDISSRWEACKAQGLARHLDSAGGNELTGRLSGALSTILEKLKQLFKALYLLKTGQATSTNVMKTCQHTIRRQLYDYKDYLAVKAQRNLTMTTFVEDYPGLVHFIYIDRSSSQMTAPSINIGTNPGPSNVDMMKLIREKIWCKIVDVQNKLKKGHLTQITREGDFLYSYFLWFEDGTVQPLHHQKSCEAVTENILPGVLAGGFYRHITRQVFPGPQNASVRVFELFMMHMGVVPSDYALKHGRQLASKMWESTGQINSTINLL